MNLLVSKLKENIFSVVPIIVIVTVLHFTLVPLQPAMIGRFLFGSVLIILGLSFFLIGVDIGITPLGTHTGASIAKSGKLWIALSAGAVLGFFISIAEPGLLVLSNQVGTVTSGEIPGMSILITVSIGLAVMVALGFLRTFYNIPLYLILIGLYAIIGVLSVFTSQEFFGIAFDASGATTGVLAVPFILSLAVGISEMKKDSKASEKDSFGLVSIASTGAIMAVMILSFSVESIEFTAELPPFPEVENAVFKVFGSQFLGVAKESFITLLPLFAILVIFQNVAFKLSRSAFKKMLMGFAYAFVGLILFFMGVNGGFMDVGTALGHGLSVLENKSFVIIAGFIIGLVTILAEPAVHVLTHQIEEVTGGYVKKKAVLISLCIGVGMAVGLSVLRILVPEIKLWHYLLPGYVMALALTFFAPKLFVGIAFDAGGVATGPMTATFILAFTQGAASAHESADVLVDGFGMISMVALMPIITLQVLGIIFKLKSKGN
ncbi:MAG: DUF1538 domain-containing protein [Oscillospiraceae bacterium]|jgi:hypothetical protein|nr:DUF1538 domain-containing protein [Oscillospiraceae bacterium]